VFLSLIRRIIKYFRPV